MSETEICASCLTSEHPIDVRGLRVLKSGSEVAYLICHQCCTTLRRFHFNDESVKMKQFWNQVWQNLSLDECIESVDEPAEKKKTEAANNDEVETIEDDVIVA